MCVCGLTSRDVAHRSVRRAGADLVPAVVPAHLEDAARSLVTVHQRPRLKHTQQRFSDSVVVTGDRKHDLVEFCAAKLIEFCAARVNFASRA